MVIIHKQKNGVTKEIEVMIIIHLKILKTGQIMDDHQIIQTLMNINLILKQVNNNLMKNFSFVIHMSIK